MKRLIIFTLLLSIILIGCSKVELTDQYVVEEKVELPKGDSESRISYPVVKGLANEKIESKVNESINKIVEQFRELADFNAEFDEVMTVDYYVTYRSKEILSIKFHEISHIEVLDLNDEMIIGMTFDLKTGERLELKDILKSGYETKLNSILTQMFNQVEFELIKAFQGINQNQAFYLNENGLVIYYLAPDYTMPEDGPLQFEIPYSSISEILKEPLGSLQSSNTSIENYNKAINENTKPFEALFFITENIENMSRENASTLVLSLEEIQENYIGLYEEILIDNNIQKELERVFKDNFNEKKINEISDGELAELLWEIINGGYMIVNLDGLLTPLLDYTVLEKYSDYLTDEIGDYIKLMAGESRRLKALNTGDTMEWKAIEEKIVNLERYIEKYPNTIKEYIINREHTHSIYLYLYGFDSRPSFDYTTKKIDEELILSYRNFSASNNNSETAKMIELYLDILERNNNTLCEEIDDFRSVFASLEYIY
ncbi:UNVERIFIED_CONTAM: uncharacterized protein DUF4163 [Acetivibrio alkalicellulosi]